MAQPFDVLLCRSKPESEQFAMLGRYLPETVVQAGGGSFKTRDRLGAIDLDGKSTIILLGAQGSGKSYTATVINESACLSIPGVNQLITPYFGAVIHYAKEFYPPEFFTFARPNPHVEQHAMLAHFGGAKPTYARDFLVAVPRVMKEIRQAEMAARGFDPSIVVEIGVSLKEMSIETWQTFMGIAGDRPTLFFKVLNQILTRLWKANDLTIDNVHGALSDPDLPLPQHEREEALLRLGFVAEYVTTGASLQSMVRPGRMVVFDLRCPTLMRSEAFQLISVLVNTLSLARDPATGKPYQKIITLDEAHSYMDDQSMVKSFTEQVRLMRHFGTTIVFASQDPQSMPMDIKKLATMTVVHKLSSPLDVEDLAQSNFAWQKFNESGNGARLLELKTGQAYIWTRHCAEFEYTLMPRLFQVRASATMPGGETVTASGHHA